jgi:Cytochrome P450
VPGLSRGHAEHREPFHVVPAKSAVNLTAQSIRPPGPKGRPLIGLFPEFRSDPAGFLLSVAQQYGDIAYLKLGHQHLYLLNRPEFVQDVLITHSSSFMKSRIMQRAKLLIGDGLLTNEGQSHLRQRRLVQPAFHRQRIATTPPR